MQADFFDLLSDEQATLECMPARTNQKLDWRLLVWKELPLSVAEPDPYLQSVFDFGKDVHSHCAPLPRPGACWSLAPA
jgi:hypothetical protein